MEQKLAELEHRFREVAPVNAEEVEVFLKQFNSSLSSSVQFALETALLDFRNGGKRKFFETTFTNDEVGIPINGLVWMGDKHWMREQIEDKISQGFSCIKLKIGALDFEEELDLLRWLRHQFLQQDLTIRLDANGAFSPTEALEKLQRLEQFGIHSVEQPIRQGQVEEMAGLCRLTPVAIALDEELIGLKHRAGKQQLLHEIQPQYIILKPTLHGGLQSCQEWIELTEQLQIPWWLTSALESNIGLNAISQFAASYNPELPQGLGTGQLYHNNIKSPLEVENGKLFYRQERSWILPSEVFGTLPA